MRIEIRDQKLGISKEFRTKTVDRLQLAVGRFGPDLPRVVVRYSDLNGPRGGVDKCCRIALHTVGFGTVVAEGVGSNLSSALARASDRASRAMSRVRARAQFRKRVRFAPLVRWPQPLGS